MFCMTHPDDELAICAWIEMLVKQGREVWISWTHDTEIRQLEALRAAAFLGVPEDRLRFFGAPDGDVVDHIADLMPRFRDMFAEVRPDRVVAAAYEQGHLDHDATNFIVNQTFEGDIFEIPLYHIYKTKFPRVGRFAEPSGEEVMRLTRDQMRRKIQLCRMFPSQRIFPNMLAANLRARVTGDGPITHCERMRKQTHRDFTVPNLTPRLEALVRETPKWRRWSRAMQNLASRKAVS